MVQIFKKYLQHSHATFSIKRPETELISVPFIIHEPTDSKKQKFFQQLTINTFVCNGLDSFPTNDYHTNKEQRSKFHHGAKEIVMKAASPGSDNRSDRRFFQASWPHCSACGIPDVGLGFCPRAISH